MSIQNTFQKQVIEYGAGGGGPSYEQQSVTLTGSTGTIEFSIPTGTRSMLLRMNPIFISNFGGTVRVQLGDDTNYYTSGYNIDNNVNQTSFFQSSVQNSGSFYVINFDIYGDVIWASNYANAQGVKNYYAYLPNVTSPITRLRITISGEVFTSGTVVNMSYLVQS